MTTQAVLDSARLFSDEINLRLAKFPIYQLDGTWPSVGTLDYILYPLRGRDDLTESEVATAHGAACYIAALAVETWRAFGSGGEVTLLLSGAASPDVMLSISGGELLKNDGKFSVAVNQALRRFLREDESIYEVFPGHKRLLYPDQRTISTFAIGIIAGLTPYGKGPWSSRRIDDHLPALPAIVNLLSDSCSRYYARVFPQEEQGRIAELYRQRLILAPAGVLEPFPGTNATAGLCSFLTSRKYPVEISSALVENLAQFPDETIAAAGYATASHLQAQNPSRTLLAIGRAFETYAAALRPASITARLGLGSQQTDTIELIEEGNFEGAQTLLEFERKFYYVPLLKLSTKTACRPEYLKIVESILCFNPRPAAEEIYRLYRSAGLDEEVTLQGVFLDLLSGNQERAVEVLRESDKSMQGSSQQIKSFKFELKGRISLALGQIVEANQFFQSACQSSAEDNLEQLGLLFTASSLALGEAQQALTVANELLVLYPNSVDCRLRKVAALKALDKRGQAKAEIEELSTYAMADRRIFDLVYNGLS